MRIWAWEWPGLGGRCSDEGDSTDVAAWQSELNGSNVVTVPQLNPLWRLLVLLRGTQGSWKVWGDEVGVCGVLRPRRGLRSRQGLRSIWGLRSRGGLEEDREGLLRPGRRLRESDRNGGGGGRLDLRREMLREQEEEMLDFLFSWYTEEEEVISSEHKELQSMCEGEERPEEISGSQLQPSPETELISRVIPLQSAPAWLL